MAIDPEVLKMQRAVLSGAVAPRRKRPLDAHNGPRLSDVSCPRCRERRLAVTNRTGVCCECWGEMTRKQRNAATYGATQSAKAKQSTIERARARLAARGIHVEENAC
jgi:hypothetical protein